MATTDLKVLNRVLLAIKVNEALDRLRGTGLDKAAEEVLEGIPELTDAQVEQGLNAFLPSRDDD